MSELATILQALTGTNRKDQVSLFDAEVMSVNNDDRTCIVTAVGSSSANELRVRLMASVDDGIYATPKIGSTVVVLTSLYVTPLVVMYSEVEEIILLGGEYEGAPIATHPTDGNKGILARLTKIETAFNQLNAEFKIHTHPYTDNGTPLTTLVTTSASTNNLTNTVQDDIVHPKITI